MQRWFIFPRESIMRYVNGRDQVVLHMLGTVPALLPLALAAAALSQSSLRTYAWAVLPFVHNLGVFIDLNRRYLDYATPRHMFWLVPVQQIMFPLQLLMALVSPQRINWRGHHITVKHGGTMRITRHREPAAAKTSENDDQSL